MSTISTTLSLSYSGTSDSFTSTNSLSSTPSVDQVLFDTQIIGTTSETLALGDLSNLTGGLLIKNMDTTNYVLIDSATTFDKFPQKILPGGAIFLASQTLTIYAKANTASVVVTVSAVAA